MRAGCSASIFTLVAAWEQSLHPGGPGHRLAHRKGLLNAENAVRTTSVPLRRRNPWEQNGYRLPTVATQTIPATVNEAPYILDELLMTRAGRRIREQYADSGGFIDHVFAIPSLLGYRFIPRIRDLPSKRLHVFELGRVPKP